MINYADIANRWRMQERKTRYMRGGVVLIWQGEVYGWKNELRDPHHEQPHAIAVDINGNVFEAKGGNDYDGAERWEALAE